MTVSVSVCSQLSKLHKAHSLRRKKRRNMLAIFGFLKNRSQSSGQGSECSAEFYGDIGPVVAPAAMGFVYPVTNVGAKTF